MYKIDVPIDMSKVNEAISMVYWCGKNFNNDVKINGGFTLSGTFNLRFEFESEEDKLAFIIAFAEFIE